MFSLQEIMFINVAMHIFEITSPMFVAHECKQMPDKETLEKYAEIQRQIHAKIGAQYREMFPTVEILPDSVAKLFHFLEHIEHNTQRVFDAMEDMLMQIASQLGMNPN